MENESLKLSDIKTPEYNHQYEDVKRCPKCSSVFITKSECESCHYQFSFDYLGEALGEKSFYTMREDYWDSLSFLRRTYPYLEKKGEQFESYKRACLHRFDMLLKFFSTDNAHENQSYNIYFLELKDLVVELIKQPVCEDLIWSKVDLGLGEEVGTKTSLYQQISLSIEEARRELDLDNKNIIQKVMDYKVAGTLRFGVLLLFIISSTIACLLAISVYRYFLLIS